MLGFSSLVPYQHPPPPCCAFLYHDGTRKQGRELHLVSNEMKQKKLKPWQTALNKALSQSAKGKRKNKERGPKSKPKEQAPKWVKRGK